jgi:thioredoxin reductase (NADPH)
VDGLYAAGDVCVKALRQVVTAVGDGALAATELEKYAAAMQQKTGLRPQPVQTSRQQPQSAVQAEVVDNSGFFDAEVVSQLNGLFSRMENNLILRLHIDESPVSVELKTLMEELAKLTDKLSVEVETGGEEAPCVRLHRKDGSFTGLAFHGVPGGHEFTSFVMGLYNAAGPGQALDEDVRADIAGLEETDIKVLVTLSCSMCPELVMAAQRIAAENEKVTAEVFDVMHFPKLREQYNVMSVPCLVINDGQTVTFGKKNITQLLELLK